MRLWELLLIVKVCVGMMHAQRDLSVGKLLQILIMVLLILIIFYIPIYKFTRV